MKQPCYQCKNRTAYCHGTCKEYKEFQKENEEIKKKRHLTRQKERLEW